MAGWVSEKGTRKGGEEILAWLGRTRPRRAALPAAWRALPMNPRRLARVSVNPVERVIFAAMVALVFLRGHIPSLQSSLVLEPRAVCELKLQHHSQRRRRLSERSVYLGGGRKRLRFEQASAREEVLQESHAAGRK